MKDKRDKLVIFFGLIIIHSLIIWGLLYQVISPPSLLGEDAFWICLLHSIIMFLLSSIFLFD